jgi:hypothetical protein
MKIKIAGLVVLFILVLFITRVSAMTATINIPEKYSEVVAGDAVYFETTVLWPENDMRKDLRLEYSVRNKGGEEVAYLKVLKAIETQASFMDFISIPESLEPGIYRIYLNMTDYSYLNQEVVASFKIVSKTNFNTYLPIILGFFGLIAILVLVELFILIRKKK